MAEAANTGKRLEIAKKAQELAVKYKNSTYSQIGKSTTAMDCSYFVYLVYKEVFADFTYINTTGIVVNSKFKLSSSSKVGDIIFFMKGMVPYEVGKMNSRDFPNHVGIVIDNSSWIGRQTSKIGVVNFNDNWWWPRGPRFYSYCGFDAAFVAHSASTIRKSIA